MKVHANAALGPAGRLALVQAIECVAPTTAHRWSYGRRADISKVLGLKLIGADGSWIDRRRLPRGSPHRDPGQRPVVLDPTPRRHVAG
jgi:hypothetical protein